MNYIVYFTLMFFLLFSILKREKIYSPRILFNFIWLVVLSLYSLKMSYIQHDISNKTWEVFLVAILSFNITAMVWYFIGQKNKGEEKKFVNIKINDKKINMILWLIVLSFFVEMIYSGGIPLIWKLTNNPKIYFDFGIPSFHGALNGLIICMGAYLIFNKDKRCILLFLIGLLIFSRQIIMSMVIEGIICIFIKEYDKAKVQLKKYVKYIIILLFLFSIIGNFRSGSDTMNKVFLPKEKYANVSNTVKWIYSYSTFSVSNINQLVNITDGNLNKGASSLKNIMPTVILDKINLREKYNVYYLVSPNYNASTYLVEPYLDFGKIGVLLFNCLMAIVGMNLYNKLKNNKNISNLLCYSVYSHNIFLLFFTNLFLYLPILIQFVYIPFIFKEKSDVK